MIPKPATRPDPAVLPARATNCRAPPTTLQPASPAAGWRTPPIPRRRTEGEQPKPTGTSEARFVESSTRMLPEGSDTGRKRLTATGFRSLWVSPTPGGVRGSAVDRSFTDLSLIG